ncbi:MAG: hypothetical protein IPI43_20070 [Sandaracinaceae bacterium]|nr:hypothetical protein [Sandaracinaceae bacterium]MBP7685338.1 hypothetical protein [Deltaproteobacteria bacterium]
MFGDGLRVQVLDIDALIAVKAHVGRLKDRLMESELRAIRSAMKPDESEKKS